MSESDIHLQLPGRVTDAVMLSAADGSIVFTNEAATRMSGYSREELLTMNLSDLPMLEETDRVERLPEAGPGQEDAPRMYVSTLVRKDGVVLSIQVTSARTVWQGQPASIAIVRDVGKRAEAEDALARSEELLRTVLDNAPGFVFSYDIDASGERQATYIGVGLRDLLGPESAESIGRSIPKFIDRIHPDDLARLISDGILDPANVDPVDTEYRVRGDGESYRWVHNTMRAVRLGDGRVRWYGVMRNVTERRKTADELARLRRVEAIGVMAGGIAHEVHNALYPARVSLHILIEKLSDGRDLPGDKLRQLIDRTQQSVDRAVRTTDEIRQFSRVVAKSETHRLALRPLLEEVLTDVVDSEEPEIDVSMEIPTQLSITINRDHAYSVLANVLANAIDALQGQADRKITIAATQDSKLTRLQITDTGSGIAEEMRDRIFEPFVSSKPRTGTGIGLAICQRILEIYNGTIALESNPTGGACVTIELPFPSTNVNSIDPASGRH